MKAKNLNVLDVLVENSKSNDKVILQISYDDVDEKNHKSLNTISHMMGEAGFNEIGELLSNHKYVIEVNNVEYGLHAHQFLNEHSAAIASILIYKGKTGQEAENIILKEIKKA